MAAEVDRQAVRIELALRDHDAVTRRILQKDDRVTVLGRCDRLLKRQITDSVDFSFRFRDDVSAFFVDDRALAALDFVSIWLILERTTRDIIVGCVVTVGINAIFTVEMSSGHADV